MFMFISSTMRILLSLLWRLQFAIYEPHLLARWGIGVYGRITTEDRTTSSFDLLHNRFAGLCCLPLVFFVWHFNTISDCSRHVQSLSLAVVVAYCIATCHNSRYPEVSTHPQANDKRSLSPPSCRLERETNCISIDANRSVSAHLLSGAYTERRILEEVSWFNPFHWDHFCWGRLENVLYPSSDNQGIHRQT